MRNHFIVDIYTPIILYLASIRCQNLRARESGQTSQNGRAYCQPESRKTVLQLLPSEAKANSATLPFDDYLS